MFTLRPYQAEASKKAQEDLTSNHSTLNNSPLIVLPTGAGKSLVIADIVYNLGLKTLIVSPSVEITKQNKKKLEGYDIPKEDIGVYSASLDSKKISKFTFGTIQSLAKNPESCNYFDLIIIDEAHKVSDKSTRSRFTTYLQTYRGKLLGFTATPYRVERWTICLGELANQEGYYKYQPHEKIRLITRDKFWFTRIIYNVNFDTLYRKGYLQMVKRYESTVEKLLSSRTQAKKEYPQELSTNPALCYARSLTHYNGGTKIILWTRDKKAAEAALDETPEDPEDRVYSITGSTKKKDRARMIDDFLSRKTGAGVIVNHNTLTTGFDAPSLEVGIVDKKVTSLPEYIQMQGRLSRIHPLYLDTVKVIIDLVNRGMPAINEVFLHDNGSGYRLYRLRKDDKTKLTPIDEKVFKLDPFIKKDFQKKRREEKNLFK